MHFAGAFFQVSLHNHSGETRPRKLPACLLMASRKSQRSSELPGPLNDYELGFLHYLMDRAIRHNQIPGPGPATSGSMSDASKRGRDSQFSDDGGDVESPVTTFTDIIESAASFAAANNLRSVSNPGSVTSAWSLVDPKTSYDYSNSRLKI